MTGAFAARAIALAALALPAFADQPVGLVFSSTGAAKITRPGRESEFDALPGRELFAGDRIRVVSGSVTFSFCPGKTARTINAGEVTLRSGADSLRNSATQSKPLSICALPEMERFPLAPQTPRRDAPRNGTLDEQIARLPPATAETLRSALAPIDATLHDPARDPANHPAGLRAARALALAQAGLAGEAEAEYDTIFQKFNEPAAWAQHVAARLQSDWEKRQALSEVQSRAAIPANRGPAPSPIKKTYAIVVGVSQYDLKSNIPWLRFASADAKAFAAFLQTPRGGGLRLCTPEQPLDCEIQLLADADATLANISRTFDTFVKDHAVKENALIVFIAAHGAEPAMELKLTSNSTIDKRPVILTYDSDYNEAKVSGYLMDELRDSLARQGLLYGRVVLFADVCHAGDIGPIAGSADVQPAVQKAFGLRQGSVGLFMASQGKDDAYESPQFGGGHGAFTYIVLRSLNETAAQGAKDLDFSDLLDKVRTGVTWITSKAQHATGIAVDEAMTVVDDITLKGMDPLPEAKPITGPAQLRRPRGLRLSAPKSDPAPAGPLPDDAFLAALQSKRLRSGEGSNNAQDLLVQLKQSASPDLYEARREQLRVALEDRGQQTILSYLRGDQQRPANGDFDRCAKDFTAAVGLEPRMLYDRSRGLFCQARYLLGNNPHDQAAADLFERSIALDPSRAYAYNGLGIAYLERSEYDLAISAFRDAIRYAPYWPYPWHNLALTYEQKGMYDEAIDSYRTAMKRSPDYSYLPLNLGLLYQRINRPHEAEATFLHARKVAEDARDNKLRPGVAGNWAERAEIWNAIGNIQADRGDYRKAEASYRSALLDDPHCKSARHDLALLLSRSQASAEAERYWRGILQEDPAFLPSRISLAEYLDREHRDGEAAREYASALTPYLSSAGIRQKLAAVYKRLGQYANAVSALQPALAEAGSNPRLLEQLADLYVLEGQPAEAKPLYSGAYDHYQSSSDRTRVRQKQASSTGK